MSLDRISDAVKRIAQQLDEMDDGQKGIITADNWNVFVQGKGGKEISKFFSKEKAEKSIAYYLTRNAAKEKIKEVVVRIGIGLDGEQKRNGHAHQKEHYVLDIQLLDTLHHVNHRADDKPDEERPSVDLVRFQGLFQEDGGEHHASNQSRDNGQEKLDIGATGKLGGLAFAKVLEVLVVQGFDGIDKPFKYPQNQRNSATRHGKHVDRAHNHALDEKLYGIPKVQHFFWFENSARKIKQNFLFLRKIPVHDSARSRRKAPVSSELRHQTDHFRRVSHRGSQTEHQLDLVGE